MKKNNLISESDRKRKDSTQHVKFHVSEILTTTILQKKPENSINCLVNFEKYFIKAGDTLWGRLTNLSIPILKGINKSSNQNEELS